MQGFPSLIVILEIHSTNILDSGDAAFPQLAASPHSMDSVLQAGEGNYSATRKVVAVTPTCRFVAVLHRELSSSVKQSVEAKDC